MLWFNVTGNETIPLIGLDLAQRTGRRIEIDSFQRLVFHKVYLEDIGSYSCQVDGVDKAVFHVESKISCCLLLLMTSNRKFRHSKIR